MGQSVNTVMMLRQCRRKCQHDPTFIELLRECYTIWGRGDTDRVQYADVSGASLPPFYFEQMWIKKEHLKIANCEVYKNNIL